MSLNLYCRTRGFTMIELIMVIVIVAILSFFALPRFFQTGAFDERGFLEQSRATIRFAQKVAIASGCDTRVLFTAGTPGSYNVQRWTAGCTPGTHPTGMADVTDILQPDGSPFNSTSPEGINVSALDFYFDRIGRPRDLASGNLITAMASLNVAIGSQSIQVQPLTGFVE